MLIGGDMNCEPHELKAFSKNSPLSGLKNVCLANFLQLKFSKDYKLDGADTIDESLVPNEIFVPA
jgi:hypothetical protein